MLSEENHMNDDEYQSGLPGVPKSQALRLEVEVIVRQLGISEERYEAFRSVWLSGEIFPPEQTQ